MNITNLKLSTQVESSVTSANLSAERDEKLNFHSVTNISSPKKNLFELECECVAYMAEHEFIVDKLVVDDSWQRLSVDGGEDCDEWYIAKNGVSTKGNPWLMVTFGTWAGGLQVFGTFTSWELDNTLSSEEKRHIKEEYDRWSKENERRKQEDEKQRLKKVQSAWDSSSEEPSDETGHLGYLSKKKICRHGARFFEASFNDGTQSNPQWSKYPTLVVPLQNIQGDVQAIQHIRADGEKRIYGSKKGNFHLIGEIKPDSLIYVAEGFATAASVYEAKANPTVVAFDCGNLQPVIAAIQSKYPKNSIIIAGDDDRETQGNPGRTSAEAAAKKYGCKAVFPCFPTNCTLPPNESGEVCQPSDWNDLHVLLGLDNVRDQLDAFVKAKPRLVSLSYTELINKQIPQRKFVLKPWLPEAAISMVFAPPGVGKSYLCLSAAGAIASGGRLFTTSPWEAPTAKRVLYVDGEMHEADLQMRVKKLLHGLEKNIPDDYLRYLNGSWQSVFIPDLSSPEGQALIEEIIVEQKTEVLFLDNLSTLCRAGRENETDSWKQMQAWLLQLRWRGIAVVLVHHAGKAKDENGKPRQRGTSMREVILESSIVLEHPKNYSEEMGCLFELSYTKARGFWGADATPLEVKLVEKDGLFSWQDKKLSVKTYDSIVDIYIDGTTSVKEIALELGISPQAVRKHIRNAKKLGDIK
jgi:putative DNA primase/helicase